VVGLGWHLSKKRKAMVWRGRKKRVLRVGLEQEAHAEKEAYHRRRKALLGERIGFRRSFWQK